MKKITLLLSLFFRVVANAQTPTEFLIQSDANTSFIFRVADRLDVISGNEVDRIDYKINTNTNEIKKLNISITQPVVMILYANNSQQAYWFIKPQTQYTVKYTNNKLQLTTTDTLTNNENKLLESIDKANLFRVDLIILKKEIDGQDSILAKYGAMPLPQTDRKAYNNHIDSIYKLQIDMLTDAYNNNKISESFFNYFKSFFLYQHITKQIQFSSFEADNDYVETIEQLENKIKYTEQFINNDSALYIPTYKTLIAKYIQFISTKKKQHSNMFANEYITAKEYLKDNCKNYGLLDIMTHPYFKQSADYDAFKKSFAQDCSNVAYKNFICTIVRRTIYNETSTLVQNIKGETKNLAQLLKTYAGKYVYIDLWASWCGPCRASFKSSKQLYSKHSNKVVFMYLSIDKSAADWKNAVQQDKLPTENCFLLTKGLSSDFAKNIQLQAIPRYILIDKQGNITSDDAVTPESALYDAFFENLLKK